MPEITVILVTYNSAQVVAEALASLMHQPAIASIMVVDNASSDMTCALIKRDFPQVVLIENATNEGFGCANNSALAQVTTPYALLLNPDAALNNDTLTHLLEATQRYPEAAIIAPALHDEQNNMDASYKRNVFDRERSRDQFIMPEGDLCAEFLSGAVWLLNMALMKKVGFFDPNIFLYYEDDDVCLRVRKAGYATILASSAKAMHRKGASSGKPSIEGEFFKQKHMIWSRLYIEKKYHGQASAKKLAVKLYVEYGFKWLWYVTQLNRHKASRYRGRLAGISAFNEPVRST